MIKKSLYKSLALLGVCILFAMVFYISKLYFISKVLICMGLVFAPITFVYSLITGDTKF